MTTNQTASTGAMSLAREIALYQQGWHDEMFGRAAPTGAQLLQYLAGRADARRQHPNFKR